LDVLFLIKMPRIWIEGGRGVPGRPAIRIIPLNFLYQHEDGFFYLQKQKIVKCYVLKGNPSSSPQDDVSSPEHVASGITTVSVHGKEAEEKAAAEVAAKREEERLAAEAAAAAEEADRKLREEQEPLRQEEERARAEAAAREEEQQKEEERLRQEEEEKKRLEAEGRAQEEKRKRQEEEAERRQMEEESADSDKPFKSRCASESVEPGWACSSSTCTTS
jgi:flagellar biosynthesis GTPase FlhF